MAKSDTTTAQADDTTTAQADDGAVLTKLRTIIHEVERFAEVAAEDVREYLEAGWELA